MPATGSCLCGAVGYRIASTPEHSGACHCGMCRKWSGGLFMAVEAAPSDIVFHGVDNIGLYTSSGWAERGFCKVCGSSLFYRLTAPGPHQGMCYVGYGTLDDPSGITVTQEVFIDEKPDGYALAGETQKKTGAELFAQFAPGGD